MSVGLTALNGLCAISQAAASGLLSAVWQGALLAAAAGLGLRLVPKAPAAVRFAIWFAVFAVVVALPVVALWPHSAGAAQASGHRAWLTLDERWSLAIAAVWVVATLVRTATLVVAGFRVRSLWRRATPVEVETPGIGDRKAGEREAQVCVSDEVDRPSVIGFFAPKILIPRWLLQHLTPAELEQIVLHEAGHLGRADDWLNLAQKIALVVFPLNPALAWIERRLCFERELACDERVLRTTGAPKAYAACLAALAEHRMTRPGIALSLGALGHESELGQRVGRILRFGEWMRPVQARAVMGVAMLGLLGGVAGLERCPQLVGFSVARAGGSQGVAGVAPVRAANEFGYQAVVFRPDRAKSSVTTNRTARAKSPRAEVAIPSDGEERSSSRNVTQGQWLVVTSWSGMNGSRVVLTTMTVPDASESAPSDATGQPAASDTQDAQQQVHRYAAVPVRGGWLVFQL